MSTKKQKYLDTSDMSRDEWLKARRSGLGGSDIGAIFGLNNFKSSYDVWLDKSGRETDDTDNLYMRFGRDVEPVLRKWFEEDEGYKVEEVNKMFVHPEHDILMANIDGRITPNEDGDYIGLGVLECKTTSYWRWKKIEHEVPESWYLQLQHYMLVTGATWGAFAILVDKTPHYLYFEADEEIHELIKERALDWWKKHVIDDEAPEPTRADDLSQVYSTISKGKVIEATPEIEQAISDLDNLKAQRKEIENMEENIKHDVEKFIGEEEAQILNSAGEKIAKRGIVSFKRVDDKKLKKKYPEVAKDEDVLKTIRYSRLYL